jgi:hypothetical protein
MIPWSFPFCPMTRGPLTRNELVEKEPRYEYGLSPKYVPLTKLEARCVVLPGWNLPGLTKSYPIVTQNLDQFLGGRSACADEQNI